ncbi:unnamed protein product [Peniophora sp. CBMAI 1063]|nr:unnamed protein product [Peniophora sp. CBMAI 1063]
MLTIIAPRPTPPSPHKRVPHSAHPSSTNFARSPARLHSPTPSAATVLVDSESATNMPSTADNEMRRTRGQILRMDAQDGPWAISVAENPHDATYTCYVKTPTHNLTLTRSARELAELDAKLRDAPGARVPALPPLPAAPKRKSAFLNTLSRLASPARARSPPPASRSPSVAATPRQETGDPFMASGPNTSTASSVPPSDAESDDEEAAPPSPAATGLASYLTTVANDQLLRASRPWKRFVRVRADDLASVRVERAIKRVRSDLAGHKGMQSVHALTEQPSAPDLQRRESRFKENIDRASTDSSAKSGNDVIDVEMAGPPEDEDVTLEGPVDEAPMDEDEPERAPTPRSPLPVGQQEQPIPSTPGTAVPPALKAPIPRLPKDESQDSAPSTPVAEHPAARIPRSMSADPDKAARMSRLFAPSSASESSAAGTASATETEDDSVSLGSSNAVPKKKKVKGRSKSVDPAKLKAKAESKRKVSVADFEMMRVLGKGCAGKVLLVKYRRPEGGLFALKAITKRHVLAHQELQHTLTEQAVLRRMAAEGRDPFVVRLHYSFHDRENLFLVMDFHPGGDLATQLARWGRLGRDRARFYAAEIVEGVEGLHAAGVIYRDLKPENILIAADGHIVLTDFGLSKEFPRSRPGAPNGTNGAVPPVPYWMTDEGAALGARQTDQTSTFCGTAEYLAPEVIQGLPYSYEVDWWSFGTMLYEMLTGITPFWADNHSDMYVRVLQDELQFPDDRAMDQDTKSLIRGLLQRNPALRISEPRIKRHPYFSMIDWSHVYFKRYIPPYIPPIDPQNASDTQNFDDTFLDMEPVINDGLEDEDGGAGTGTGTDTDAESAATPSQSRSSSAVRPAADQADDDVFDGYSFKGRHSVIIDDDAEEEEEESEEEDEEEAQGTRDILAQLNGEKPGEEEPKTPEARRRELPEPVVEVEEPTEEPATQPAATEEAAPAPEEPKTAKIETKEPAPRKSGDRPPLEPSKSTLVVAKAAALASAGPDVHKKEIKAVKPGRARREKSGVPALDADLPSEAEDRDEEDDDWDFLDDAGGVGSGNRVEERNGARGTSLFARGVVDRYRLAVFRKGSTPGRNGHGPTSATSEHPPASLGSPAPKEKEKSRGRAGLPFRRIRAKSPTARKASEPGSLSRPTTPKLSNKTSTSLSMPGSSTVGSRRSVAHSASGTPSTASRAGASRAGTAEPSLRSKMSETSFNGPPSGSSDASLTEDGATAHTPGSGTLSPTAEEGELADEEVEPEKQKNKKLKKYKEGAEKVLSLFASPKHPAHHQAHQ